MKDGDDDDEVDHPKPGPQKPANPPPGKFEMKTSPVIPYRINGI